MKRYPTVFIICGVHNNLEDTKRLLKSIKVQSYKSLKTIVIDDGSTDKTVEYIKKNYPEVRLIYGDGNLWWTGAIFAGVSEALKIAENGDFILTINNDCTFESGYITNLVQTSLNYERAIVGSLILDKENPSQISDAGIKIDWPHGKIVSIGPRDIFDIPKNKTIQDNIDTLTTKGTIYPIEVFLKIGNFDKKHLPHYISDYEFGCRAKRHGFKLVLSYKAQVYNDIRRTGFGDLNSDDFSIPKLGKFLFSRKSGINMIDHFWFITLCCPRHYLLKNYILLAGKFFYLMRFSFMSLFSKK